MKRKIQQQINYYKRTSQKRRLKDKGLSPAATIEVIKKEEETT